MYAAPAPTFRGPVFIYSCKIAREPPRPRPPKGHASCANECVAPLVAERRLPSRSGVPPPTLSAQRPEVCTWYVGPVARRSCRGREPTRAPMGRACARRRIWSTQRRQAESPITAAPRAALGHPPSPARILARGLSPDSLLTSRERRRAPPPWEPWRLLRRSSTSSYPSGRRGRRGRSSAASACPQECHASPAPCPACPPSPRRCSHR